MAKQKLSDRTITATKAGGYVHIIIPTLVPGVFDSYRISTDNLLAGVGEVPILLSAQTGNVSQVLSANTWIDKITVFFKTGAPTVRIGTFPNGEDIMADMLIADYAIVKPEFLTVGGTTIYMTINTGTVDVRIDVKNNYNGNI